MYRFNETPVRADARAGSFRGREARRAGPRRAGPIVTRGPAARAVRKTLPALLTAALILTMLPTPAAAEAAGPSAAQPAAAPLTAASLAAQQPAAPLAAPTPTQAQATPAYKDALHKAITRIRTTTTTPIVGSIGGEWAVLALARAGVGAPGDDIYLRYLSNVEGAAKAKAAAPVGGKRKVLFHNRKYTENERVAIALTALGKDASAFQTASGTYDVTAALLDKDENGDYEAVSQGINGAIYALIALDSGAYLSTGDGITARAWYLDYLMGRKKNGGGWALSGGPGSAGDPDITGMTLQALAPYYRMSATAYDPYANAGAPAHSVVRAAVEEAVATLKSMQLPGGDFAHTEPSSESAAQVLAGLASLDYDGTNNRNFMAGVVANLLTYRDAETGGFRHVKNGEVNAMATEQAAYALVAYDRCLGSASALYSMNDVTAAGFTWNCGYVAPVVTGPGSGPGPGPGQGPGSPAPQPLSGVTLKIADKPWTGKQVKSGLTITATYGAPARTVKLTAADYTIVKSGKWYKDIGKARVTVKARGPRYTGARTVAFKIVPAKLKLRKLTAAKKQLKAVWKPAAARQKITGYQVQYKLKSASKWPAAKSVSKKKLTHTARGMKKGKRYQARVRAYKKVGGVKYYGPWSAAKLSKPVK